jgi:hypothetical protein
LSPTSNILDHRCIRWIDLLVERLSGRSAALWTCSNYSNVQWIELLISHITSPADDWFFWFDSIHFMVECACATTLIVNVPTILSDQGCLTLEILEPSLLLPYQTIRLLLAIQPVSLVYFASPMLQFTLETTHSICTSMTAAAISCLDCCTTNSFLLDHCLSASFDACSLLPMLLMSNTIYPKETKKIFHALSNPKYHEETMTLFSALPLTHSCDQDDGVCNEFVFVNTCCLTKTDNIAPNLCHSMHIVSVFHSQATDLCLDNTCLTKANNIAHALCHSMHIVSALNANHFANMHCLLPKLTTIILFPR